jgi:hypothetical protein
LELQLARTNEAAAAYQQALVIRHELRQPNNAAEMRAGLARVALSQGEVRQALNHAEEILAYLTGGGTVDGADEPLRVYLTCYRVLQAAGDSRASAILETAHTLLQEQAAKIPDQPMRRSFLENVPYHRALVAAWAEVSAQDTDHPPRDSQSA